MLFLSTARRNLNAAFINSTTKPQCCFYQQHDETSMLLLSTARQNLNAAFINRTTKPQWCVK
jgi:hypothetical protein